MVLSDPIYPCLRVLPPTFRNWENPLKLFDSHPFYSNVRRKYRTTFEAPAPTIIDFPESNQTSWLAGHFRHRQWGFPAQSFFHLTSPAIGQLARPSLRAVYPSGDRTVQP
jgi:hypothetical protein